MTVRMGPSSTTGPAPAGPPDAVDAALAPVRTALVAAAEADAAATLAAADAEAAATVAAAEARAAELVARARADGAADAESMLAADRARGRREGRRIVLAARSQAYDGLRHRARAAVVALRTDPAYEAIVEGLAGRARALLGADAVITRHPYGGVLGSAPGRRCDLSLPTLADRAFDSLGPEVERLWTP
jgi:vacuolar-type H+-ATPase subunit E/Vma4